tara:strand:+ start:520 stop:897 length:378 start_codon:yes stop_codon:yes gene_type:complete
MSDYIQDPNDSKKQAPGALPDNAKDRVSTIEGCTLVKTPNAVIIGDISDDVGFFFGTSASFSEKVTAQAPGTSHTFLTASSNYQNFGTPAAGTTLNIHPMAFSGSARDTGSIHFLYSSGLSTGPR